jgi:hypothetical protein
MSDAAVDLEGRIRERAYFLWEAEGRPEGRAEEFWARAVALEATAHDGQPSAPKATGGEGGSPESIPAPRATKSAAKRATPDALPGGRVETAAGRRPTAAPRGSKRKGNGPETATRATPARDDAGALPPR